MDSRFRWCFIGTGRLADTVAEEMRMGLTESERVPLHCASDVMHILDTIREQIGLVYDDLEQRHKIGTF